MGVEAAAVVVAGAEAGILVLVAGDPEAAPELLLRTCSEADGAIGTPETTSLTCTFKMASA